MNLPCVTCKGREPSNCGRTYCPIIAKYQNSFKPKVEAKKDYQGPAPSPFVGRHGYPNVNVGILSTTKEVDDPQNYDDPRRWAKENTPMQDLIEKRLSLANASFSHSVKQVDKQVLLAQEVAMAKRPVDVEVNLKEKLSVRAQTDAFSAPHGPRGKLLKARPTENARIHTKVDRVYSDTDLKAADAINYLFKHNFDENFLSRILSVGTTGRKLNRKLVPTRWSITATDDIIGNKIMKELWDYKEINPKAYFGGHLGNYFLVLTFPGPWSYELFETWSPNTSWNAFNTEPTFSTDYEGPFGRKEYAHNTAGGYYAARLPILEQLKKEKRIGSVIALRFISGEYDVPMGVWVVREAARKAMESTPIEFADKDLLIQYARLKFKRQFNINADRFFNESLLLKAMNQPKLSDFFN